MKEYIIWYTKQLPHGTAPDTIIYLANTKGEAEAAFLANPPKNYLEFLGISRL